MSAPRACSTSRTRAAPTHSPSSPGNPARAAWAPLSSSAPWPADGAPRSGDLEHRDVASGSKATTRASRSRPRTPDADRDPVGARHDVGVGGDPSRGDDPAAADLGLAAGVGLGAHVDHRGQRPGDVRVGRTTTRVGCLDRRDRLGAEALEHLGEPAAVEGLGHVLRRGRRPTTARSRRGRSRRPSGRPARARPGGRWRCTAPATTHTTSMAVASTATRPSAGVDAPGPPVRSPRRGTVRASSSISVWPSRAKPTTAATQREHPHRRRLVDAERGPRAARGTNRTARNAPPSRPTRPSRADTNPWRQPLQA